MSDDLSTEDFPDLGAIGGMPTRLELTYQKIGSLPSGANAHQQAALYGRFWECFELISGDSLAYRDILQVSTGAYLIGEFEKPTVAVLKENAICGVCSDLDLMEALDKALGGFEEPVFVGTTLVMNQTLTPEMAAALKPSQLAMIVAPGFDPEILDILKGVQFVAAKAALGVETLQEFHTVAGGVLLQDRDHKSINMNRWQELSERKASDSEKEALLFAMRVLKHVRSAGVVVANGECALAIAGGQPTAEVASFAAFQQLLFIEERVDQTQPLVCAFDRPLDDSGEDFLKEFEQMGFHAVITPECELELKMDERVSYFVSRKECVKY